VTRIEELLEAAASALDEAIDPFSHSFLVEHSVTSSECFALSEQLAVAARLYVILKRNHLDTLGALMAEMVGGPELGAAFASAAGMQRAIKNLKNLGQSSAGNPN
jgi:hypothetical protein